MIICFRCRNDIAMRCDDKKWRENDLWDSYTWCAHDSSLMIFNRVSILMLLSGQLTVRIPFSATCLQWVVVEKRYCTSWFRLKWDLDPMMMLLFLASIKQIISVVLLRCFGFVNATYRLSLIWINKFMLAIGNALRKCGKRQRQVQGSKKSTAETRDHCHLHKIRLRLAGLRYIY